MDIYNADHPAYAQAVRNAIPSPFTLCRVASDDSNEISKVPLPAKRLRANFAYLPRLSAEVILNIIAHLDAPSAVCFALTSHLNYSLTLVYHRIERLSHLCPRDVRELFPPTLQDKAYNVLMPEPQNSDARRGWQINNFHGIPSASFNVDMISAPLVLLAIHRLAYIRRVEWLGMDREQSISASPDIVYIFSNGTFFMINFSPRRIPVPVEECKAYMMWYVAKCIREGGPCSIPEHRLSSFATLWDQAVIESVEYMVLRELLSPWLQRLRYQGFNVDAGTRRKLVRERYGFMKQDAALKGRNATETRVSSHPEHWKDEGNSSS
ncbi:hypothetical protein H2200_000221 [Cladophialophora chaetospira]|uniref:F-box domain-containing protein n=1 Tax=Cladophialophora chaetospira TaxID=386627 RepID=A0AA38XN59_9EURO|nr:hypothetical protein H2200_000221 [Cladophialophora chaetospira]